MEGTLDVQNSIAIDSNQCHQMENENLLNFMAKL